MLLYLMHFVPFSPGNRFSLVYCSCIKMVLHKLYQNWADRNQIGVKGLDYVAGEILIDETVQRHKVCIIAKLR